MYPQKSELASPTSGDGSSPPPSDVESHATGAFKMPNTKVLTAEAEDVVGYAESVMESIMESVTESFGDEINSIFFGSGEDDGANADVITLLFVLAISKIGLSFSVGIDWSLYDKAFGWLNRLSILAPSVPNVSVNAVKTVAFVFLLLLQPACWLRMNWLSREHAGVNAAPLHPILGFFTRFVRKELRPYSKVLTPLLIFLWLAFWAIFIPTLALKLHQVAGFSFILLGLPATYLTFISYSRQKAWEYVYLRCADVVRIRQFENLCLQEGSFVLFVFVAAYTFVLNFLISLMADWKNHNGGQNFALVLGFLLYGALPLYYLYHIIVDENADRTFRIFRTQLVSPFTDQQTYMKLVLLVEAVLFAMLILLGSSAKGQLAGSLVVSLVFFVVAVMYRPYEDDMENYSDIVARSTVCITLFFGLIIQDSSSTGMDVILILVNIVTTLWFLYTLDLKEIFLSKFFLLLQLYAQSKAVRYTKANIEKMSASRVRKLAKSPIEFHVLSSVQRIHFATLRKADFFSQEPGSRITELADIGVTWLDLQQMGFTVTSLRELGFTNEEMVKVDAQLDDMGDRSDIQKLYEDIYNSRKAELGDADRATLESLHQLGMFYRDIGEHVMAMERLQECYKSRQKVFGLDDEDTLVSQQYIAEYYVDMGRQSDALDMLRQCVETRNALEAGPDAPAALDCSRALGVCLTKIGLALEALRTLENYYVSQVRITMANQQRRDHPSTLNSRLAYGMCLAESGCYTSIPDLKLGAIMNRQKTIYGADHPETLKLMDRYANLLSKMGAHPAAMVLLEECVFEKAATLGPDHTGTIGSKFELATSYIENGRNNEVEKMALTQILNDQQLRLGETHPSTISSRVKLGALYHNHMDRHKEALELFREVYDYRVKALGKDHELTLGIANNIAATLDSMGQYKEAREMFEETLRLTQSHLGPTHLNSIGVMINLGQLYQSIGDLEKTNTFYQDTLRITREHYGEHHPMALIAYDFVACLHLIKEEFQQAHDIFVDCARLREGVVDEAHPTVLSSIENIASCKQRLGMKVESLAMYEKVVALRAANQGVKHVETIKARAGMAIVMAELNRAAEALAILNACVIDTSAIMGPEHPKVIEYIGVIGYIYAVCGVYDEALRFTNMSLASTVKIYGEYHHLTKQLLARKVWMLTQAGRHAEAQQCQAMIDAEAPTGNAADYGSGSTKSAGGSAAAGEGDDGATISPLQKQLSSELDASKKQEDAIMLKINTLSKLVSEGKLANIEPLLQDLANDLPKIKQVATFLNICNLSAYLLNAGQAPVALQLMQVVYPIVQSYFGGAGHMEVVLPTLDLLGKCYVYSQDVAGGIPILEEFVRLCENTQLPESSTPQLMQTYELLVQCYGHTQQYDKAIELYTSQFQRHSAASGEASEPAITALNSRAMYYFALKKFDQSKADHKKVYELLVKLQGKDHPETIMSLDGFIKLYKDNGMKLDIQK